MDSPLLSVILESMYGHMQLGLVMIIIIQPTIAHVPGPHPPAFVGDHYYCESGNTRNYDVAAYYNSDVLWDGHNCVGSQNNCCANPDMPWFFRQFARNIHGEKLEARICHQEEFANEDILVQKLELYVQ